MLQQHSVIKNITVDETGLLPAISDWEFGLFKELIYEKTGIALSNDKHLLVASRLSQRLRELSIDSFETYFNKVIALGEKQELQCVIDLLTTNETYFFREQRHFDYLKQNILSKLTVGSNFSVWCAASSTGEEAYSAAMVIAGSLGLSENWSVIGTDIHSGVIRQAQQALYVMADKGEIEKQYLMKYCLKGVRTQQGMFLIDNKLKKHVNFESLNLNGVWKKHIANFDLVFLRNVMIYFDNDTKKRLINRIADSLKLGGYLFIGHADSMGEMNDRFKIIQPSILQRCH